MTDEIHIVICVPSSWTRIGPPDIPLLDDGNIDGLLYNADDGVALLESVMEGPVCRTPSESEITQANFTHNCLNEFYATDLHEAVRRAGALDRTPDRSPRSANGYRVLATDELLVPHYRKDGHLIRPRCDEGIYGQRLLSEGLDLGSRVQIAHATLPADGPLSAHERIARIASLATDLEILRTHLRTAGDHFAPVVRFLS